MDKLVLEDGKSYDIDDVLNKAYCKCGKELEFLFNEDGGHDAYCGKCGRDYHTCISTVTIYLNEQEELEDDPDPEEEPDWISRMNS